MHAHGCGVPQDYSIAAKWFKACAERGSDVCMVGLGNYLKSGLGVQKDLLAAYAWFNVAASKPGALTSVAVSSRDQIARELSPEQLSKAQELSLQLSGVRSR